MMAEKARAFGDRRRATEVLACASPTEAKRLGRGVRDFDERTWRRVRVEMRVRAQLAADQSSPRGAEPP